MTFVDMKNTACYNSLTHETDSSGAKHVDIINEKYEALREDLRSLGSAAVAFSSGVDSTLLLAVAGEVLGDNVMAVTAASGSFPVRETGEAKDFCQSRGIKQVVIKINEMEVPGFKENPENRCYLCKKAIFSGIIDAAKQHGMNAVCEGSNTDDLGDYRPGLIAIKELGVKSPLRRAGLNKAEIRELSRRLGLPTWSKPSFACLASRFVYGEEITSEKLKMVEQAEELLLSMGFEQERVRIHGTMARIELLPSQFGLLFENDNYIKVNKYFKELGFSYVSLDLGGYKTGSMNLGVKPLDISQL